jgi:hypothetical protein
LRYKNCHESGHSDLKEKKTSNEDIMFDSDNESNDKQTQQCEFSKEKREHKQFIFNIVK